jgi:hypothetical protein
VETFCAYSTVAPRLDSNQSDEAGRLGDVDVAAEYEICGLHIAKDGRVPKRHFFELFFLD